MSKNKVLIRNYESQINSKEIEIDKFEKIIKGYGFSDCETRNDFEFEKLKLGFNLEEVREDILKAGSKYDPSSVVALKGKEGRLKTKINEINDILVYFDKITKLESEIITLEEKIEELEQEISSQNDEREQMDVVLKHLNDYKSCEDAAKLANVEVKRVVNWIHEGRQRTNKNKMYFFNEFSKIKSRKNSIIAQLLKHLKNGSTRSDACNLENISINTFNRWYEDGKNGKGKKNIDFYNRVNKIEKINEEKNRKLLIDKFLSEYRKTRNVNRSIQYAGISQKQYHSWCSDGRNRKNRETIYFVNELDKINRASNLSFEPVSKPSSSSNNHDDSKILNNDEINVKKERLEMDSFLNIYRRTHFLQKSLQSAGISQKQYDSWCCDGRNRKSKNTIYFVNELDKIKNRSTTSSTKTTSKSPPQKEKMDKIVNHMLDGKTRFQAANLVSVPASTVNQWYVDGWNDRNVDAVKFYRTVNRIEDYVKNNKDEKQKMMSVLNYLRQGKSYSEAARHANVDLSLISSWRQKGINRENPNAVYFYNNLKQIENYSDININSESSDDSGLENPKNNQKTSSELNDDLQKMGKFLQAQREGNDKIKSCEIAGISLSQLSVWINQGRSGKNNQTIYFVNEYDKLNPSKNSEEYIPIKKNHQIYCPNCNKIIDKRHKHCIYCGYELPKEKGIISIFNKIRKLF